MKILEVELVGKNYRQRFYKLSHPITKGVTKWTFETSIKRAQEFFIEGCKKYIPTNGINIIVISDSRTHIERLVFAGFKDTDIHTYHILDYRHIAGQQTWSIDGGDIDTILPDEDYLREIAKINGFDDIKIKEYGRDRNNSQNAN